MAITAALVTALGGGNIDYVPITPSASDFSVSLPAGTWLVQIEVTNSSASNSYAATVGGGRAEVGPRSTVLLTRVVSGGPLTGKTDNTSAKYNHGIAIRLGD